MNNEPDIRIPSFTALVLFGVIAIGIIMTVCRSLGIPIWIEFIFAATAGWYARRIILFWQDKLLPALLISLNNWLKK